MAGEETAQRSKPFHKLAGPVKTPQVENACCLRTFDNWPEQYYLISIEMKVHSQAIQERPSLF